MATSLLDNTASRYGRSRQGSGAPSWSVCWSCCSSRSLDRSVARPPACPDWSARWRGSRRRTVACSSSPREKGSAPTEDLVRAVAVRARPPSAPLRYEPGPAEPTHWPLDLAGFVTRGQVRPGDPAESHPGIDIAVPAGTAVRAAGGGVVQAAGTDPAYGLFVLLRHSSGYETMYGHASSAARARTVRRPGRCRPLRQIGR